MSRSWVILFSFAVVLILAAYFWNGRRVDEQVAAADPIDNDASEVEEGIATKPENDGETTQSRGREVFPSVSVFSGQEAFSITQPHLLQRYGVEGRTIDEDLQSVHGVLQSFWLLFKDPDLLRVGSNEAIMACLSGRNPEGIEFVSPKHPLINENGALLDRWGKPLFFHALSLTNVEVRSAGPDGRLFNGDDVFLSSKATVSFKR